MRVATVAKHSGFGLLAYFVGLMLYARGEDIFNLIVGAIGMNILDHYPQYFLTAPQILRPFAYLVVVAVVSSVLAFVSPRYAFRYSLVVLLGTLSFFCAVSLTAHYHFKQSFEKSITWLGVDVFSFALLLLLPIATFLLVRAGWLTRRSSSDRPQAAGRLS